MTQSTDVSNLDFDSIQANLKAYLQSQSEFTDYNFEGSGIATLVDLLAYNTHLNAMLAHMNINETFLDTARARANVVAHAQAIGYVPRSARASVATVDVLVVGTDITPSAIAIPKGYTFTGKVNSTNYTYTVLSDVVAQKKTDTLFETGNNYEYYYQFTGVPVHEGELITQRYRVDSLISRQSIEIYSNKIDTTTLQIKVFDTATSNTYQTYVAYDSIDSITGTSPVFFIKENSYGNYEIYFGDDFIGKILSPGNVIEMQWIDTNGAEANGIKKLVADGSIDSISNITTTTVTQTAGGQEKEGIESIRYNAPVSFATQNRAVTANDYKSLLVQNFPEIKDVSVWGGEDATPPVYGKVYISPALFSETRATEALKSKILTFIEFRNVGSTLAEIVDAEYTYLKVDCEYKFNPRASTFTLPQVSTLISETIQKYDADVLNQFTGVYRQSRVTTLIDQTDPGITSSIIRTSMYKSFVPNPNKVDKYEISFPVQLYQTSSTESVTNTDVFLLDGRTVQLLDEPASVGSVLRSLYIFDIATQSKVTTYGDIGYVDPINSKIVIQNLIFDNSNRINIYARPNTFDITPKYNQLLNLLPGDITVTGDADTVALYSVKGLTQYNPSSRH